MLELEGSVDSAEGELFQHIKRIPSQEDHEAIYRMLGNIYDGLVASGGEFGSNLALGGVDLPEKEFTIAQNAMRDQYAFDRADEVFARKYGKQRILGMAQKLRSRVDYAVLKELIVRVHDLKVQNPHDELIGTLDPDGRELHSDFAKFDIEWAVDQLVELPRELSDLVGEDVGRLHYICYQERRIADIATVLERFGVLEADEGGVVPSRVGIPENEWSDGSDPISQGYNSEREWADILGKLYRTVSPPIDKSHIDTPRLPVYNYGLKLTDEQKASLIDHVRQSDMEQELARIKIEVDGLEERFPDITEATIKDHIRCNIPAIALEGLHTIRIMPGNCHDDVNGEITKGDHGRDRGVAHASEFSITIYAGAFDTDRSTALYKTLNHELGHALSNVLPVWFLNEWDRVASSTRERVSSYVQDHYDNNTGNKYAEDFVESFARTISYPDIFKILAPRRFETMKGLLRLMYSDERRAVSLDNSDTETALGLFDNIKEVVDFILQKGCDCEVENLQVILGNWTNGSIEAVHLITEIETILHEMIERHRELTD